MCGKMWGSSQIGKCVGGVKKYGEGVRKCVGVWKSGGNGVGVGKRVGVWER